MSMVKEKKETQYIYGIIFVVALIGAFSPSYQKCAANHERHDGQNEQPELHETIAGRPHIPLFFVCEGAFIDENNGTLTAIATIAIAGFTLTLWRATTEQARLTRDSLQLARDEFTATHRPRIRIRYIENPPVNSIFNIPTAQIFAANIGPTDAIVVATGVAFFIEGDNFDATPKPVDEKLVIPSGSEAKITVTSHQQVTATQLQQIGARSATLCMLGIIRYEDRSGTARNTSFFRVYEPVYGRFNRARESHAFVEREYED